MKNIILLIFLTPTLSLAQTPKQQGLQEYSIPEKSDTIHFYIYSSDTISKKKIFLYLQGSGDLPMVNGDDSNECCYNNYPKKLMKAFPAEYAFVYIQKVGLPYYVRNIKDYSPGKTFFEHDNVIDRANAANKVINYILKNVYPETKIVAVLGHSEGGDVAAKLATINSKITHLCFASDNGTSQAFTDVLLTRRKMRNGELTASEAQAKLNEYYSGLDSVFKNPNSTANYFNGNSYKWNSTFNKPPIENLLKLNIPILLTIGSNDEKVPVETSDFIVTEFIRHSKTNLTQKVYLNCNHSYIEIAKDGSEINHWNELFMDFLKFAEQNSR